jgi:hypothetical protein
MQHSATRVLCGDELMSASASSSFFQSGSRIKLPLEKLVTALLAV